MKLGAARPGSSCVLAAARISARRKPFEVADGRFSVWGGPFEPVPPSRDGLSGRAIVCAVSYFSFRPSVARRRDENSWTQVQTRYRKGPEPVQALRKLARPVRVVLDRFGTGFAAQAESGFVEGCANRLFTTEQTLVLYILVIRF